MLTPSPSAGATGYYSVLGPLRRVRARRPRTDRPQRSGQRRISWQRPGIRTGGPATSSWRCDGARRGRRGCSGPRIASRRRGAAACGRRIVAALVLLIARCIDAPATEPGATPDPRGVAKNSVTRQIDEACERWAGTVGKKDRALAAITSHEEWQRAFVIVLDAGGGLAAAVEASMKPNMPGDG